MKDTAQPASPEWHPIGPRRVEISPCESCSGAGTIVTSEDVACEECFGNGYICEGDDALRLCRKCHGVRTATIERRSICESCSGKGKSPEIRQTLAGDVVCPDCNGRGTTSERVAEAEAEICDDCDGTGSRLEDLEHFAQDEWMASKERPAHLEPREWSRINEVVEWRASTGEFISIVECPRCKPSDLNECLLCVGTRRVVRVAQPCNLCGGEGEIHEVYYSSCLLCGGRGTIRVTESRLV